ncbi:PREDICTED: translation initiation factor IF-2-like [Sturnus vulgaris]|uniref:translation initiation factor IF-2-like n=1 Tax=Sturnus vulgaris TaxID=9172 RepID=UPI00071A3E08|nr:PREDICTED: translation initiation factor IF-2-like [Sturnus vulgaris]
MALPTCGTVLAGPRPATASTHKVPTLLSQANTPSSLRTRGWKPAATRSGVTVTPRKPPQLRSKGDRGPAAPRRGGGRRLPSPAENKVSSAPALTPGAICSGRAGLRGCRGSRPPRGSCHAAATRRRLRPGTTSSPVALSPSFPREHRQLHRERGVTAGSAAPAAPSEGRPGPPNPTPRPDPNPTLGVRDGDARRGERHIPDRTDGAPHRAAPRGGTAATGTWERTPARAPRRGALPVPVRSCGFKSDRSGAMCSAPNKSNNKGGRRTPPPPPGAGAVGGPGGGPRPRPAPAPPRSARTCTDGLGRRSGAAAAPPPPPSRRSLFADAGPGPAPPAGPPPALPSLPPARLPPGRPPPRRRCFRCLFVFRGAGRPRRAGVRAGCLSL